MISVEPNGQFLSPNSVPILYIVSLLTENDWSEEASIEIMKYIVKHLNVSWDLFKSCLFSIVAMR